MIKNKKIKKNNIQMLKDRIIVTSGDKGIPGRVVIATGSAPVGQIGKIDLSEKKKLEHA